EWPVASFQGGLFRTGPGLEESKQHFLRRLQLCQQLSIGTLVMAVDPLPPLSQELLDQIPERMQQISAWAAPYGTRLALEFQHDAPFLNNLKSLMHLLDELDQPNLGVCLDTMAFEKSSSKESDLELLDARLFHVHLCDFDGDFRELWSKHEAVLPGDGSCRHQAIARYLKAHAYEGAVSVQLQNPMIWAIPPRQLAEVARMSIERFLEV
ncbi:MAG: sugar phosphate isomerase/epimerase family protein, partial [Planctomycetota bacterium]